MPTYEIITDGYERIVPFKESVACKLNNYSKIDKKIEEIIGPPEVSSIIIRSFYYANPGKRFHIDVHAKNGKEAMRIVSENREKIEKVYREIFGEKLGKFRIWGAHEDHLASKILVRKHAYGDYYDFIGKVEVVRNPNGSSSYIKILDRKTGELLGEIFTERDEIAKYNGKVISFRGMVKRETGIIFPHIEKQPGKILKRTLFY